MGLDTVELVMGFEEALGMQIPDEDAARLLTPRMVLEYAAARLPIVPAERCLTQHAFYALRRGFRAALPAAAELRPATPLRALTHRDGWTVLWTRVRVASGEADWPKAVPWQGMLSGGPSTLGELARHVVPAPGPPAPGEPWTRERLELVVRDVVGDVAGITDFSMDDEFVRDMRLD